MSHIDDLPPLRDVIATHGLTAKKALGQNFLLDLNITMKIVRTAGDLTNCTVLEIGPGPGGLTRALLASGARHVVAIERDDRCLPALRDIAAHYPGRLTVISDDALAVDHKNVLVRAGNKKTVRIVANLPYNIATPLLTAWVGGSAWPPFWQSATLMFQREVAQRITAKRGEKAWGRLGVLTDWRCRSEIAFDLPPQAFTPPPKVTSSVVMLEPRREPLAVEVALLERVTQAAFGQRRKMLRQSLKSLGGEELLARVNIDPTMRAENLTTEQFVALAQQI
ncbi:MAG: 16S rRNA (adenine(1518)-N(6)/adenine(1519)-N(6))-dimethyltransferase RsmA [Ahrensia sp.]|nr:16S rRNA (adenine(1518)-N(6)/adenine(1519)-N(6))-dimethyltransferase RsmA [Ahrensia sp.]